MSTMYMLSHASSDRDVACYAKFLLEALRPNGINEIPVFNHTLVHWSNGVVFFDTAHPPDQWLGTVRHFVDQGNVVIVIYDDNENAGAMMDALSAVKNKTVLMPRTWEADTVRGFFNTAVNILKAKEETPKRKIWVITPSRTVFDLLVRACPAEYQFTLSYTLGKLLADGSADLVVLDAGFSILWPAAMREITEKKGLKVVVAGYARTSEEVCLALAVSKGGTALDYLFLDGTSGEIRDIIERALAYQPRR